MDTASGGGFVPVSATGLTIFRRDRQPYSAFYAPGFLAVVAASRTERFESALADGYGRAAGPATRQRVGQVAPGPVARELADRARYAQKQRAADMAAPFQPVCLTLYLGARCNLRCTYCYASSPRSGRAPLALPAIRTAARHLLDNCERRRVPLTVVFHGGGEPTLYPALVDRALDDLEQLAGNRGVPLFRYLATNGVMPETRARAFARRFDTIGISCDGPPHWQFAQRPTRAGRASTQYLERTAAAVRGAGTPLHVRVTVTPLTLHHQPEIARYVCEHLAPDEIRVEPVYPGGRAGERARFEPDRADEFVAGFLEARRVAAGYGVPLRTSGSRIGELHGPYCNVLRDVLQLVPGGVATTCFKTSDAAEPRARATAVGHVRGQALTLRPDRIAALRRVVGAWPDSCARCFNRFHCVLGCPDCCPLDGRPAFAAFRCRVQTALAQRALDDLAEAIWQDREQGQDATGREVPPGWA